MVYDYDKPTKARETLAVSDYSGLSDEELLTLLIEHFDRHKGMPLKVLNLLNQKGMSVRREELLALKLSEKAVDVIMLCNEWSRRHAEHDDFQIKTPKNVYELLKHFAYHPQEQLIVVTLDGAHNVINTRVVTIGLVNMCMVHPREVFKAAIQDNASAIVIAHNHPSGHNNPSPEDRAITERLVKAGNIMGIHILDHVIITKNSFASMKELGMM